MRFGIKPFKQNEMTCNFLLAFIAMVISFNHASAQQTFVSRRVDIDGFAGVYLEPKRPLGPAVVIIAGSGPTDRDGNNPLGLYPGTYKALAEELAKNGIASLRYDKRGIGQSSAKALPERDLTVDIFAQDAALLARWLGAQKGVSSVSFIGHSEGGLIALVSARYFSARSIVLLCTPGRPLGDIIKQQLSDTGGVPELQAEAQQILSALERGEDVQNVDVRLAPLFRPGVQPFVRSLMRTDAPGLAKTFARRIMVVGGGRDKQITRADFDVFARARPDAQLLWEPEMSHTLTIGENNPASQTQLNADPNLPLARNLAPAIADFLKRL